MTKTKYEFSSQAWVDCAHEILLEAAGDTDLSGIEVTFSEVFTTPPNTSILTTRTGLAGT